MHPARMAAAGALLPRSSPRMHLRWLVALGKQCSGGADHGLTALQVLCFILTARLQGAPAPAEQLASDFPFTLL